MASKNLYIKLGMGKDLPRRLYSAAITYITLALNPSMEVKVSLHLGNEVFTLLDACLEFRDSSGQQTSLIVTELAQAEVLLQTILPKEDRGGEVGCVSDVRSDVGTLSDAGLSIEGFDHGESKPSPSIGHGQGGTASSGLGLHHLSTSVLNPGSEGFKHILGEGNAGGALGDEGDDGDASMSTNNRALNMGWVQTLHAANEGIGSDDIKGGDTKDVSWVLTSLLVNLCSNGDCAVHWVADDAQLGLRANLGTSSSNRGHNGGIGVEEVISGHAWLARNTSRDDHHLSPLQRCFHLVSTNKTSDLSLALNVRQVSSHTRSVDNIIKGQLGDKRGSLA